jgi:DNA repair exonuclease SbcCD ATPase subunit
MKPPKEPSVPLSQENQNQDFEQELLELEQAIVALKERYNQVQADKFHQRELQQRLKQLRYSQQPKRKAELKQIKQQLEVLEINLESQLFSWGSLKEPFWQAVRFGGLGVIIGWLLKSVAG